MSFDFNHYVRCFDLKDERQVRLLIAAEKRMVQPELHEAIEKDVRTLVERFKKEGIMRGQRSVWYAALDVYEHKCVRRGRKTVFSSIGPKVKDQRFYETPVEVDIDAAGRVYCKAENVY